MNDILFKITGQWSGDIKGEGSFTAECERKGDAIPIVQMLLAAMDQDPEIRMIIETASIAYKLKLQPDSFTMYKQGYPDDKKK